MFQLNQSSNLSLVHNDASLLLAEAAHDFNIMYVGHFLVKHSILLALPILSWCYISKEQWLAVNCSTLLFMGKSSVRLCHYNRIYSSITQYRHPPTVREQQLLTVIFGLDVNHFIFGCRHLVDFVRLFTSGAMSIVIWPVKALFSSHIRDTNLDCCSAQHGWYTGFSLIVRCHKASNIPLYCLYLLNICLSVGIPTNWAYCDMVKPRYASYVI